MKLNIQQFTDKVTEYIVGTLIPSATMVGKGKIGFLLPYLPNKIHNIWPLFKELEIVDNDGNIDVDRFFVHLDSMMNAVGNTYTFLGFTFGPTDVEAFGKVLGRNKTNNQQPTVMTPSASPPVSAT